MPDGNGRSCDCHCVRLYSDRVDLADPFFRKTQSLTFLFFRNPKFFRFRYFQKWICQLSDRPVFRDRNFFLQPTAAALSGRSRCQCLWYYFQHCNCCDLPLKRNLSGSTADHLYKFRRRIPGTDRSCP